MVGPSRRRRRSESFYDDHNDRVSSPESDAPKRRRTQSVTTNGLDADVDMTAFQPGAIVRVNVENFVTYEKAEFLPGPYLNMVIGPNGTGKSSLVCAICLGLGYSPKHLGRAGSVKEFVKHGKDTATIEIELMKRPEDRRNFIIRVQIRREQNSQRWWINGKETTAKNIQELMKKLKIQVDNLCQFLPQDRVVEFAACTPVALLHETLRAAAPEEMLQWQSELKEMHQAKKVMLESSKSRNETLENLENRQRGLQADVDRLRERQEIQQNVENLGAALVLAKYQDARQNYLSYKHNKAEARKNLKNLERASGPSLEAVNKKQLYAERLHEAISQNEEALKEAYVATRAQMREVARITEASKDMPGKIDSERKSFESNKKLVGLSKSKITSLQGDLKNKPAEFIATDWNQKIRAEEHKIREIEASRRETQEERQSLREKAKQVRDEKVQIKEDITSLETQEGRRINLMKRIFPEVATAWEWIQQNQDRFEKEVFGPPMITCSVTDERYSDQIQSLLHNDDFICFTTQTQTDFRTLSNQVFRDMGLSVVIRSCPHALSNFKSPLSQQEAQSIGLDGFAVGFLDGPKPVLAMLCAEKKLHASGVSVRDHTDEQYQQLINSESVNQWAAGKQSFMVRRRKEYGPNAMTTITKNIPKGRFWTSQQVDPQEKEELSSRLARKTAEMDTMKEKSQEIDEELRRLDEERSDIEKQIDKLKSEKDILQRESQKYLSLPDKIASEERQRDLHEKAMKEARVKLTDLQYEWDEIALSRIKAALRHKEAVEGVREAYQKLAEMKICVIEAESDIAGLKERNSDIMERLDREREKLSLATTQASEARTAAEELSVEVHEVLSRYEGQNDMIQELVDGKTTEIVEAEIDSERAKLELIHAANPNVIREFERRADEIQSLQREMETSSANMADLNGQLDDLMGKWEPELERLVSKINDAFAYNFEQISCAGEVRVNKVEDFDQWSLDIMVRFRENETLQQLTAHRQSGGERAVSTIFFLMALQSMAQSPFRVVDEINQGMDPRNERMVHERMVEIACREHTSQYFLITPKLLNGLHYDPKMRILCIVSGEHVPRDGPKIDLGKCIEIERVERAAWKAS